MGIFKKFGRGFKQFGHEFTHPFQHLPKPLRDAEKFLDKKVFTPDNLDIFGDVVEVVGAVTGQPEIVAVGVGIKGGADVLRGRDKIKGGKVGEGIGDILTGLGKAQGKQGKKLKEIGKVTKKIGKEVDSILITEKVEQQEILDLVGLVGQEGQELRHLDQEINDLAKQEQLNRVEDQHFEAKILQREREENRELVSVIDDLAERLEESNIDVFDVNTFGDLLNRLESDDIIDFLARQIKDFNGMNQADQDRIIDLAIFRGA